ncbi:MAG: YggT family protein [Candidatus Dormibacteraceae bacterium]
MERRDTEIVRDPVTGTVREERRVTVDAVDDQAVDPAVPVGDSSEVVSSFNPAGRAVELIYLVFGIINGLLLIRVVLKLLGANALAGFASFVYGITGVFLAPFRNLLPTVGSGQSQLEMSAVVAILVYALIGWVIARIVKIMFSRSVTFAHSSRSRGMRPRGY